MNATRERQAQKEALRRPVLLLKNTKKPQDDAKTKTHY